MALIDTDGPLMWADNHTLTAEFRNDSGVMIIIRDQTGRANAIVQMSRAEALALQGSLQDAIIEATDVS